MNKLTEEQNYAVDMALREQSLRILAGAGTGKTTVLCNIADKLEEKGIAYKMLAFNSSIAKELKQRGYVAVTQHSFCLSMIRSIEDDIEIAPKGYYKNDIAVRLGIKMNDPLMPLIDGGIKSFLINPELEVNINHIPVPFWMDEEVQVESRKKALKYTQDLWNAFKDDRYYSHDGYMKRVHELGMVDNTVDYLLVDEAQDTNIVFSKILDKQKHRMVVVGDPNQAIYQWRNAVDYFTSVSNFPTAHLSNSFRFPNRIAEYANAVLETNEGDFRITGLGESKGVTTNTILHRTNLGCIMRAYELRDAGKKFRLDGGVKDEDFEYLKDIKRIMQSDKKRKHPDLRQIKNFDDFSEQILMKEDEFGEWNQRMYLIKKLGGLDKFEAVVMDILSESEKNKRNKKATMITTCHKYKGNEADAVKLSADFIQRFKGSDNGEVNYGIKYGKQEEKNLLYVGVTRAKNLLDVTEISKLFPELSAISKEAA